MGQQHLLLIILGVLIVGAAIAVGLRQFLIGSENANREAIVNDIVHIVGDAQRHYHRPSAMGGGNGSFSGYTIPAVLSQTGNAKYQAEGNGNELIVEGISIIYNRVIVKLILTRAEDGWLYDWAWEHEGL